MLVPALVLALVSGVFFLFFRDAFWLSVGRFLNGVSVGAVTATATAWLQELYSGPPRRARPPPPRSSDRPAGWPAHIELASE